MKKLIAAISIIAICATLTACSLKKNDTDNGSAVQTKTNAVSSGTEQSSSDKKESSDAKSDNNDTEKDKFIEETKKLMTEGDKPTWSKTFLDKVNIDELYKEYAEQFTVKKASEFAQYITNNAEEQSDWKTLFEKDLKATYEKEVSKYVELDKNVYQAYAVIDGTEVPFVVVNSVTGYFHG